MALALPIARIRRWDRQSRHHAEFDFRLPELRSICGENQVAHHGQLAAAAQREAWHRGDHRGPDRGQPGPRGEPVAREHVHVGPLLHLLDVRARCEGLFGTGNDDAADAWIAIEALDTLEQFPCQLLVERVERLGRFRVSRPELCP